MAPGYGGTAAIRAFWIEGRTPPAGEAFSNADQRIVAADYFRAMQIPLLEGRLFSEQDVRANPRVTIVDHHMAQRIWPGESPVGKQSSNRTDATDLLTFASVAMLLTAVAGFASGLPHAAPHGWIPSWY